MNLELKTKSIRDRVAAAIASGQIKMRPRWHFAAQAALLAVGVILFALALLYVASFVVFIMHQTGLWRAPGFGWVGLRAFLFSLPWLLLAAALIFLVILEVLVKRYAFAYGRPLFYSVIGIVLLVIVGGFLVERTSLHRGLLRQAKENRLPWVGPLYRNYNFDKFNIEDERLMPRPFRERHRRPGPGPRP